MEIVVDASNKITSLFDVFLVPAFRDTQTVVSWLGIFLPYFSGAQKFLTSKVVSTHLWNAPLNLYQQAISRDSFHTWRTGDCRVPVCDFRGVARNDFLDNFFCPPQFHQGLCDLMIFSPISRKPELELPACIARGTQDVG